MGKAQRLIEEAEQHIRIGKLYITLSATPLGILLIGIFPSIVCKNWLLQTLLTVCVFAFSIATVTIGWRIAKNHEIIQIIASARTKLNSEDDILDTDADRIFRTTTRKSVWILRTYLVSLFLGYLSLVPIVVMAIWG